MAQLPKVQLTSVFRQALQTSGRSADDFANGFATWKASGNSGLLVDPYFGKDSPYARPRRLNRTVLWHTHLRPESDQQAILEWDQRTREGLVKTSDAVLIYTHDLNYGYLLLHAVWENGAHEFANMATQQAATLMNRFADTAEAFSVLGKIII